MALKIITAETRLAEGLDRLAKAVTGVIFGESGSGKTTLARTLDPTTTLFIDLEAGVKALAGWADKCNLIDIRKQSSENNLHPWMMCKAIALLTGGPDPSDADGDYSRTAYDYYCRTLGTPDDIGINKSDKVFIDSITVASRHAFSWCKTQPAAFNEKGKFDNRGAYGLLGQELVKWFTQWQHAGKNLFMVGILDKEIDDLKRISYKPQIEGGKAGRELPGIFDQVMTIAALDHPGKPGEKYRAIIPRFGNPLGFPAKDRSGCLEEQEPPDLGYIIKKIQAGVRLDAIPQVTIPAAENPAAIAA